MGTEGILKKGSMPQPAPVTVRIGEGIDAPSSTERENQAVTQQCVAAIQALHDLGR